VVSVSLGKDDKLALTYIDETNAKPLKKNKKPTKKKDKTEA